MTTSLHVPRLRPLTGLRLLFFLISVSAALLLASCSNGRAGEDDDEPQVSIPFQKEGTLDFLRADGTPVVSIDIEIAESDSARTRGLMQRTSLPDLSGMLFIFDREEIRTFWMANTPLSLDMFFVDADGRIIDVAKYVRPMTPESTRSSAPAQYVIEVVAGFADSHGLTESDRVEWRRLGEE